MHTNSKAKVAIFQEKITLKFYVSTKSYSSIKTFENLVYYKILFPIENFRKIGIILKIFEKFVFYSKI